MKFLDDYIALIIMVVFISLFLASAVAAVAKGSILLGAIFIVAASCFILPIAIAILEKIRR